MARTSKSKPPKKSRIVSSADNSTTLTCTHNNAHRLAQMRAVVLRTTLTAGRRRLGQSSTHGEMEVEEDVGEDEPTPIDEVFTMDFAQDIESDESDSEDEDMGPKRPPPRPCQDFLPYRKAYLDELIRHDGFVNGYKCVSCSVNKGLYTCTDCAWSGSYCAECTVQAHKPMPFHRIKMWNRDFFVDTTLQRIGQEVQLGHDGGDCESPIKISTDFEVLDLSGQHTITVAFCGCPGGSEPRIQLLRAGWFPASTERPNSAFTFDVLNTFQLLHLQAKLSAYDFYCALVHKTDNIGVSERAYQRTGKPATLGVRDRYEQLLPIIRIWRHLKMLKRAGRAHDPIGIESTLDGECAVECPVCPHPGKNIPATWEDAAPSVRWIYCLILTVDANFRLKLKEKGNQADPALGNGWSHWVPREDFNAYVDAYGAVVEPNYCDSELRAVNSAPRNPSDWKASGAGACVCGRHGLVRKNGLGNLFLGERYANMDFIVFCGLVRAIIVALWFSYDIICQWSRKLLQRNTQLPMHMQVDPAILEDAKKTLPKFHEYNHGYSCQTKYAVNITRHTGRTNNEDPERFWAYCNPASMSTREMGEGSREDTLDDLARSYNFRKITRFGSFYPSKVDDAIEMRAIHQEAFESFDKTLPKSITDQWGDMVTAWDADSTQPNPYVEPDQGTTTAAVKLELAEEEAADAARGVIRSQDKSVSSFLCNALDLEEEQRVLLLRNRAKSTTLQASARQEKRNTLRVRIERYRQSQLVYMPGVPSIRETSMNPVTPSARDIVEIPDTSSNTQKKSPADPQRPEYAHLWLPSAIPSHLWPTSCLPGLPEKEKRLRVAQADDALADLRRQLRVSATIRDFKRVNIGGTSQREGTRTNVILERFRQKVERTKARYRAAYAALKQLDPSGEWTARLQELKEDDIRSPHCDHDDEEVASKKKKAKRNRPSEGRRMLSWIWLRPGPGDRPTESLSADEISDDMRAEWARMKARADRWSEEVIWLVEEMRRILQYFLWRATWWRRRRVLRTDGSPEVSRGLDAYAVKQAYLTMALAHSFAQKWYPLHQKHAIAVQWPSEFIPST